MNRGSSSTFKMLYDEIREIEQMIKDMKIIANNQQETKTKISKEVTQNNDIITQTNIEQYLMNILT